MKGAKRNSRELNGNFDALQSYIQIALFGILAFLCCSIAAAFSSYIDLSGSDENSYVLVAQLLPNIRALPNWAPLYSYWYWGLFSFIDDPITVFYANAQILYVTSCLALFLALRGLKVGVAAAFWLAWCYALMPSAVSMFPRVYQFGLIITLCTVIFAARTAQFGRKLAVCATGSTYLAFVRPEVAPFALLLWAGFFLMAIIEWRNRTDRGFFRISNLTMLILAAVPVWVYGSPLFTTDYNRGFEAFTQGFALNLERFEGSAVSPYSNNSEIISQYFGQDSSVLGAALHSPGWFLQHIAWNAEALLHIIWRTLRGPFGPSTIFGFATGGNWFAKLYRLIWFAPVILLVFQPRKTTASPSQFAIEYLYLIGVFIITVLGSLITITDYRHGFLIATFGVTLVLARLLATRTFSLKVSLIAALLATALTPRWGPSPINNMKNIATVPVAAVPVAAVLVATVLVARTLITSKTQTLTICPGFLTPYVSKQFASIHAISHPIVKSAPSDIVVVGPGCTKSEAQRRGIDQFREIAAHSGYRTLDIEGGIWTAQRTGNSLSLAPLGLSQH